MQLGVVFPQTEIGADPGGVRAYAQAVEGLGFAHLLAYEHVLGADPVVHAPWNRPYDITSLFHEPFVLFGYLATLTTTLELVSGVVILPQRQTTLVAKQAAEVDVLSQGRLRLGVGIGWSAVEYEALGQDVHTRGKRFDEQLALLRRLWTETSLTYEGTFDRITGAGLNPLPVQRPIPLWIGGSSAPAYRRMGRVADGWFPPMGLPGATLEDTLALIAAGAHEVGRDPAAIGMDARVHWRAEGVDGVVSAIEAWRAAGATHVSVNTMDAGFAGPDAHVAALAALAGTLGLPGAPARG